jgi:dipeptidyl aminopeptidase/acylaminoacyl peptidase
LLAGKDRPEVRILDNYRRITFAAVLAGFTLLLLISCGDDDVSNPQCTNCDFWRMAFGRLGRFPAACPTDPQLIAFCSTQDTSQASAGTNYHIWVARLEESPDTTMFYQITADDYTDYNPSWSPDGQMIAFERNIGAGDQRQIYVVEVADLNNPGVPVPITVNDSLDIRYSNLSPSWVEIGGESWIVFCNTPLGSGDSDIGIIKYPDMEYPALDTAWISLDPSDFARDENGVMSYIFEDQHVSGNGTELIAFSSPDRQFVGDIRVLAQSEEQPDTTVAALILINDRDSGVYTPHTFRYRPAGEDVEVSIAGRLDDYCSEPGGILVPEPGKLNTFIIDFVHTHGTLAIRTSEPSRIVFVDGKDKGRTPDNASEYGFFGCIEETTHTVWTEDVYGDTCGIQYEVDVRAGEITYVDFVCGQQSTVTHGRAAVPGLASPMGTGGPAPLNLQNERRSVWLVDLGDTSGIGDDSFMLVDQAATGLFYPALSPDGRYVAYIRGAQDSWQLAVSDISDLVAGGDVVTTRVIGLPGSWEDIECWREIEKISWLATESGRKIVASLSPCRGGAPDEFQVWIADLSRFLPD